MQLIRDIRLAIRSAQRGPALALTVVLTLALGLGVSTTVFALIDAMLLRPLPVTHPERLAVFTPVLRDGTPEDGFSIPEAEYLRARSRSLTGLIAYDGTRLNAVVDGSAEMIVARLVSGDVFATLGVNVLGRPFTLADDRPGVPPVAVASCEYATRQFTTPTAALGRTIMLNDLATTIVGVMPCNFSGLTTGETPEDVWLPMTLHARLALNDHTTVGILGRLAPATDLATAARELTELHRTFQHGLPVAVTARDGAQGLRDLSEVVETPLRVLTAAAIAVLLLVCANAANLLLARGAGRRQELTIRLAMGASRWRLVRQLITESFVYALAGGALGVFIAWQVGPWLAVHLVANATPLKLDLAPHARVLAFAAGAVLLTLSLAGIGPAFSATRLETGRRTTSNQSTVQLGRRMVMIQVSLSLVLLIVTGQLGQGVAKLAGLDPGFAFRQQLQFRIYANTLGYSGGREIAFYERVRSRLDALPGVAAASVSRYPVATSFRTICHAANPGEPLDTDLNGVGDRFWDATGIPLLRGRDFTASDGAASLPVAILSQAAAQSLFPGIDAIGQTLRVTGEGAGEVRVLHIVGVTRDVRAYGARPEDVGAPTCRIFVPLAQAPQTQLGQVVFVVRTTGHPSALFAPVRRAVQAVDPRASVLWLETGVEAAREARAGQDTLATSAAVLAGLALVLACVGLYGVVSYAVLRRMNEMGIRLALGAEPLRLFRMVLRDALRPVMIGLGLGLVASTVALRFVGHSVIGLDSPHPLIITAAGVTLLAAAIIAAVPPAVRAAQADPVRTLAVD